MATHNVFPEADKDMSNFAHAVLNNNTDEVVEILQRTSGLVTKQVTYQKYPTFARIKGYHALLLATGRFSFTTFMQFQLILDISMHF